METTQPVPSSSVRLALCIRREDAPASVRVITEGTHFLPVTEEFFATPVELQDRATCETDPAFLQLLPYIMIRNAYGDVFRYFRGGKGTEERLHGKISVGVGGHMDNLPARSLTGLYDEIKAEAVREIKEEISIVFRPDAITINGLLYNPTGVNQVHLGILCTAQVSNEVSEMLLEEGVIEEGAFVARHVLTAEDQYTRLEDWSKMAVWWSLTGETKAPD